MATMSQAIREAFGESGGALSREATGTHWSVKSGTDLDHSRDAHHIALTLYMHAGDDNIVSDVSDLPPAALAAETRTEIGAVDRALFLLDDLGLVRPIRDQITGATMYVLLMDSPPDHITARGGAGRAGRAGLASELTSRGACE